jgi:hypothetical protein
MTRLSRIVFVMVVSMMTLEADGQALFSPRSEGLASSSALVNDIRGFTANPAGLTGMKNWDVMLGSSITHGLAGNGFVFEGVTFGRPFLERHALAFQYSPGTILEIAEPANAVVAGFTIPTQRTITFAEPGAVGYAFRWSDNLSLGIQGRIRTEKVSDPQYEYVVQDTSIVSVEHSFVSTSWYVDAGMMWRPAGGLRISLVGRSLVQWSLGEIPVDYAEFNLPRPRSAELTVALGALPNLWCSVGATTDRAWTLGAEWNPVGTLEVRGGMYGSTRETPAFYAFGAGLGWSYSFIEVDASYLLFTKQTNRLGVVSANAFDPSSIRDIRLNPYTKDRASISVRAMLGNLKESLARIEGINMLEGIYPSAYEAFAYKPVGEVHVRNISTLPIQARALFFVEEYMDQPTESAQVTIAPGSEAVIPLTAVFNARVKNVAKTMIQEGTVSVTATVAEDYDDKMQTRVLIHGKNDWDGDILSLRYFVTPDEPEIIRYSRDVLLAERDSLAVGPKALNAFRNARILFNSFAGKMTFVSDPRQSADYVQYPVETLKIRGGDCDDMTVCFASLLSSVGIGTAFVDVVPPDHPDRAHVYLLFDSGVPPTMGGMISSNEKRYVTRRSKSGEETLWIPIETTVVTSGFEKAWEQGAQQFFDEVEVQLGLVRGWVRIVDVY